MAMTLVSTVTVGSGGAASITFSNIDQTGKDLLILVSSRQDAFAHNQIFVRFNGDSANNYTMRRLQGSGSAASSVNSGSVNAAYIGPASPGPSETANTFGNASVYITNYTGTQAKSLSGDSVTENNATQAWQAITAAQWSGTSAISSITILGDAANFVQHSTASLYIIS